MERRVSPPVTWTQRREAARIITELRNGMNLPSVARIFDFPNSYVPTMEYMTKKGAGYYTPSWAVLKVLEYKKSM